MNCDAAKVEPVEAKIELNWEFQPGSEACQDPTMGGGQLHCIGLTSRTIPPPPKHLSGPCQEHPPPLWVLSIRSTIVPSVLLVGMTASLLKLFCQAKVSDNSTPMHSTRIHQDIFISNTQWWLRSCSGIYGARYLLNVGEKS